MTLTDQQWLEKVNLLQTMPGIGQVISAPLVSDLPELGQLTAKQISRLVGVAPIKAFYERLLERGKAKKLALTACVRKILVILNAMVRLLWVGPGPNRLRLSWARSPPIAKLNET